MTYLCVKCRKIAISQSQHLEKKRLVHTALTTNTLTYLSLFQLLG